MSSRRVTTSKMEEDYSDRVELLRKKVKEVDEFHKGASWMKRQSDATLLRFLRGHFGDVDEALQAMMSGSRKRWDLGTDTWFDLYEKDLTAPAVLIKGHWPLGITGRDHRGKPVVYNHLTAVDFPGLVNTVGMPALLKHMIFQVESLLNENPAGEATLILDLGLEGLAANFSEVRIWIQTLVSWVKKLGAIMDCYPETFSKIIFTRAPKMFWATWKVTKNFIPERTLSKVKVLSAASGDCLPVLLDLMDADSIPTELGGMSRVVLGVGGRIPKNALDDDDLINQMRAHVRLMQGDFNNGRQSARFSSLRTKVEEDDMQEQLALELLKSQIEEAKTSSKTQASSRGSWRFEPGLDVLDTVDDSTLLNELKNENFDPAKTLERLKKAAAKTEGIKVPLEKEAEGTNDASSGDEKDGKKKCSIM